MTWRTALYLLIVLLAAVVVATTAISDSSASVNPGDGTGAVAHIDPLSIPMQERSSRVALLIIGAGIVIVTYRRAWLNFRS